MLGFGIKEQSTTTGTGNLTVSSVSGFPRISDVFPHATSRRFWYSILDADGKPLEHGIGYLTTDANTLVREKILATYSSGTYDDSAPAAVNLAAGTKYVVASAGPESFLGAIPGRNGQGGSNAVLPYPFGVIRTDGTPTADRLIVRPIMVPVFMECAGPTINVRVLQSGKNAKVGLYAATPDGWCAKQLAATGNVDLGSTGVKEPSWSGGSIRLQPGWYCLAYTQDGSTVQLRCFGSADHPSLTPLGIDTGEMGRPFALAYKAIGTTLTLPDPMDAISGFSLAANSDIAEPIIALRVV